MSEKLIGIALKYYRGIGEEIQYIAPFAKLNFFIGANNSGKSIILNFLARQLSFLENLESLNLNAEEKYRGRHSGLFFAAIAINKSDVLTRLMSSAKNRSNFREYQYPNLELDLKKILDWLSIENFIWSHRPKSNELLIHTKNNTQSLPLRSDNLRQVWSALTGSSGGSQDLWNRETLLQIGRSSQSKIPKAFLIPAKRVLGSAGEPFEDLTGRGLIDQLAKLQNPSFNMQEDREKFKKINNFLREILGKPDATLEVPNGREHLLVHLDNKVLPLSSLGTGIHELVLIAAFCTIHDGSIMCMEEPEIHLHPALQRKLINYLIENTTSQYFIATHSSAFINTPDSSIFYVSNDGSQTYIKPVLTKNEQRAILDDLGYQASDILQSNAVVWVEGPSDKIYINHWIKGFDASLSEGIHYSIMFYGGALISHITASDEFTDKFIKLRDLNRNMAIVMDSDRGVETESLKQNVQRIVDEISTGRGVAWVTNGREIENYIDGDHMQAAMKAIHPKLYVKPAKTGQFDHSFYFWRENPDKAGSKEIYKGGDKVAAANLICKDAANLDVLDLRERIAEIVSMIRKANLLN